MSRAFPPSAIRFAFILASFVILAACSSDTSSQDGPAACVAAGGKCIIGPGMTCAKVGPQDCNPGRNPGGAICCLEEKATPDASSADAP